MSDHLALLTALRKTLCRHFLACHTEMQRASARRALSPPVAKNCSCVLAHNLDDLKNHTSGSLARLDTVNATILHGNDLSFATPAAL